MGAPRTIQVAVDEARCQPGCMLRHCSGLMLRLQGGRIRKRRTAIAISHAPRALRATRAAHFKGKGHTSKLAEASRRAIVRRTLTASGSHARLVEPRPLTWHHRVISCPIFVDGGLVALTEKKKDNQETCHLVTSANKRTGTCLGQRGGYGGRGTAQGTRGHVHGLPICLWLPPLGALGGF